MTAFDRYPHIVVKGTERVTTGWKEIAARLTRACNEVVGIKKVVVVEIYPGAFEDEITDQLERGFGPSLAIRSASLYKCRDAIKEMVHPEVTDDRLFGYMSRLEIDDYFEPGRLAEARKQIDDIATGTVLIVGTGAAVIPRRYDLLVYADMARWEIQLRMRRHEVNNLGVNNKDVEDWMLLYKKGYFVDWRVCDKLKKKLMNSWDFVLDTNDRDKPKLVLGGAVRDGLRQCLKRPFSVVPYFDPAPWGGEWMEKFCNLEPRENNYGWCFNCVPEENSLLLKFENEIIELPSINLVFIEPRSLLGEAVHGRFGDEFPIRFDFLDTMGGGNLSLQVHPLTEYIQEKFGVHYTQDESYYMMDAKDGAVVYLGLKEGTDPEKMVHDLETAEGGEKRFEAEKYVETWPVKKHDHFLIPAGTVHCSGKDCMVLEISATPYIFTFKLWDWGRLGLDGKPRPINVAHGKNVIQWDRITQWTRANLVNRIKRVAAGDGWVEERTGLHEREFIETRRHWFNKRVVHNTNGSVNVINLVEGDEVIVESPSKGFDPVIVHYAETFIVPAAVGTFSVSPFGRSEGKECATIKAFVRT